MNKCRYIPANQLSPKAAEEYVQAIHKAILTKQIRVTGTARNMLECLWQMRIPGFILAVQAHIEAGYAIYQKSVPHPPTNCLLFDANVRLDPDSDSEEDDVYVEIRLSNGAFVLICNSHPHYDHQRLPK